MRAALCLLLFGVSAAAAGCGDTQEPASGATPAVRPAADAKAQQPRPATTVITHRSPYGRILTDRSGRTLYIFTRERDSRSRCYGACAEAWPPLIARGRARAGGGAQGALIGVTARASGAKQVTYAGRPLYYYVGDRKAGQVLCQNVVEFGGTWLVADARGRPVR
jgi:predicted lipoprotein with Yx(FWY)xxD motif